MVIEVKAFSFLRHCIPFSDRHLEGDKWEMPEGSSVAQVLKMLNLHQEQDKILFVNGRSADGTTVLKEGDVLHVFPPICGG